ncbi:ribose-phosphate pyrophosphokinase [Patescibacteria group bacterium]|nr:ribose-phosphate pyrophosphokinase [Patescibacteria group bacterium]MCL5091822.1 ribose-phosphate pyrophosphokinase [Patescibacteria group bacterium]
MVKLFSGTAHQRLAQEIANYLNLPISRAEVIRFGNSEVKVTIQTPVKHQTCLVVQPTSNPTDTHLMELFLFCDALKREEAEKVIAVIPYFGYAKQNLQHRPGECVSVNVVVRFLETIGFAKVYAIDIHDEATAGVFNIPFAPLSALPLLAEEVRRYFSNQRISVTPETIALVAPDQGAVEKVRNFGRAFFRTERFSEAVIEKKRDQNLPHHAEPLAIYGDVKDKIALIVDDMIVSGSTVIPAVDLCLKHEASAVYVAAVHHDFTPDAPKKLQETALEKLFTTNTIALRREQQFPKLMEFSVAKLIADNLR